METDLVLQRIRGGPLWDQIGHDEQTSCRYMIHRVVRHRLDRRGVQQTTENMKIKYIIAALVAAVSINLNLSAQNTAPAQAQAPQTFQLGEIVKDTAGNEYRVVLEPIRKVVAATPQVIAQPAPVAVAPAPVAYAQPGQVVYAQPPQGNGLGRYVGDTVVTGAGGAAQGAILGAVTGRNVGKEALGMGAGAAGGKVAGDLLNGIFRR